MLTLQYLDQIVAKERREVRQRCQPHEEHQMSISDGVLDEVAQRGHSTESYGIEVFTWPTSAAWDRPQ